MGAYEVVCVDLPSCMNRAPGLLNLPLALLPLLSLVLLPGVGGPGRRAVPISPASPPAVAALVARQRALALRCIDPDFEVAAEDAFCPDIALREDYRVYEPDGGLDRHFAAGWRELETAFGDAAAPARLYAIHRAASALQQLRATAPERRKLLVVDWQLWWLMTQVIDDPAAADIMARVHVIAAPSPGGTPATLFLPDPRSAWQASLLDDYPALVAEFHQRCLAPSPPPSPLKLKSNVVDLPLRRRWAATPSALATAASQHFDKRLSLDQLLVESVTLDAADGSAFPMRVTNTFAGYLPRLLAIHHQAVPSAASQLLPAARACGGWALARRLREAMLAYPKPPAASTSSAGQPSLDELVGASGRPIGGAGRPGAEHHEAACRREELLDAALESEEGLTRLLGVPVSNTQFTVPSEYELHRALVASVQRAACERCERGPSRPAQGSLRHGIDFKATLLSFAGGPPGELFVFGPPRVRNHGADIWTPVVFLLDGAEEINDGTISPIMDTNAAKHRILLGDESDGEPLDHVYTIMTCVRKAVNSHGDHLRQDFLAAIGFLFASSLMGPQRHAQATGRGRPACRTDPDFEPEWQDWSKLERIIGWSIKYGDAKRVAIVASNGFTPPKRCVEYARQRQTRLVVLSLNIIAPRMLQRLRRLTLTSPNLRRHPDCEQILRLLREREDVEW